MNDKENLFWGIGRVGGRVPWIRWSRPRPWILLCRCWSQASLCDSDESGFNRDKASPGPMKGCGQNRPVASPRIHTDKKSSLSRTVFRQSFVSINNAIHVRHKHCKVDLNALAQVKASLNSKVHKRNSIQERKRKTLVASALRHCLNDDRVWVNPSGSHAREKNLQMSFAFAQQGFSLGT